jgi:uncharacterized protein with beta-barrel porin domain
MSVACFNAIATGAFPTVLITAVFVSVAVDSAVAGGGQGGANNAGGGTTGGNGGDADQPGTDSNAGGGAGGIAGTSGSPNGGDGAANGLGSGGGGGGYSNTALPNGTFTLNGGNGGIGPNFFSNGSGGAGGGAGGNGAELAGTGPYSVGPTSTVNGGTGGAGGSGSVVVGPATGGGGGSGGIGIVFSQAGATLQNAGTITGGNGGTGGTGGAANGANGAGGVGVVGSGLTIINNGTVAGGLSADGVTRADAIVFTGGVNFLGGVGTVGSFTMISSSTFAPGSGTPGSSMTVAGNLALQSGAIYLVQISSATSSFANVTGTATLGGATVNATFANGSFVSKQYTILTAGSRNGTFGSLVNTNLPTNFTTSLSYDPTHAFLNLTLNFVPPGPSFGSGLNLNQQAVANTLVNFFNTTGGIPMAFGTLSPSGLTQVSGEAATGSQQTTFNAMTQFMGLMTDPFMVGRGDGPNAGGGANGYADEANAYAGQRKPSDALAAIYTKAPAPVQSFEARWSTWIAGYGGSQTTDGNAVLGSNDTTSSVYATAVGADYRFSPDTIAGFSLAGGGTNFNVVGSGYGRSDLFQAGAFIRHTVGAAYISGALAYGWQDITTDRIVTAAGSDHLRAEFNANAFSGRVEGGYRFVSPWIGGVGITPYAAGQFTTFDLPAYAESALSGANTFALAYGAKDVTDTRSELGFRTDKSFAMQTAILTLRSRFAWAHDFNPDRSIAATFQALPGASFVVNGAAQASDSALTTASAELKWTNNWSVAATFEGEFSNVTSSYAGKGVVRYQW